MTRRYTRTIYVLSYHPLRDSNKLTLLLFDNKAAAVRCKGIIIKRFRNYAYLVHHGYIPNVKIVPKGVFS